MPPTVNHGVIRGSNDGTIIGGNIPFIARNPSGDWTPFLPLGERQSNNAVDTMACVSFSLLNCIETQEFFLTGVRPNYSDRWLAKKSGTTSIGNYLVSVADAVVNFGLVREESWPTPANYTWNQYYANPTPAQEAALLAEGKEWLRTHRLQFEFIQTTLADILKFIQQSPLQIVIPGHAIMNFYEQQQIVNYFDSYEPYKKQTTRSALTDVFKPILTMKSMRLVNDNGTIFLVGNQGKLGLEDMDALNFFQLLDNTPIENASTAGIPQIKIMGKTLGVHG